MKKYFYLTSITVLFISSAFAQSDSIVFVSAPWKSKKIIRGVTWKHHGFEKSLFGASQYINILEVKKRRRVFDLGYEKQVLKTTSDFGREAGAIAAINGTFFDIKNGGSVDFIKSDGQIINENRLDKDGNRTRHQKAAVILKKRRLLIGKWDETTDWEKRLDAEDVMLSGPLLLFNSKEEEVDSTSFSKSRHPRTAIAVTKKKVLLITVDGRDEHAAGMSLPELRKIIKWLGAIHGLNLDGGGSTALWIYNQPENGIVSYPSDNKVWDHAGERKVANVILVKKRR